MTRRLIVGVTALLVIGAGLGIYFALGGSLRPHVPATHRSAILDEAVRRGLIHGYSVTTFAPDGNGGGKWEYLADGGAIGLSHLRMTRMSYSESLMVTADRSKARAGRIIAALARQRFADAKVSFFETTTLGG
jgi:hypothetical protein